MNINNKKFRVMPNDELFKLQDFYVRNILSVDPVNRLVIEVFLKVDFAKLRFADPSLI